jgi:hypothetical protein
MWFRTIGLMGLSRVNLLSGRKHRYRVGFGSTTRCALVNPLGHARAMNLAGMHRIRPEADFQLRIFFFFFKSVL